MSALCDGVIQVIKECFPELKIKTEEHVSFRGQRLFIDILLPQLNLIIEVHGRQHKEYVPHFHGSLYGFLAAKKRDSLKEEWAHTNDYTYLVLWENDLPITKDRLLELIREKQNG